MQDLIQILGQVQISDLEDLEKLVTDDNGIEINFNDFEEGD